MRRAEILARTLNCRTRIAQVLAEAPSFPHKSHVSAEDWAAFQYNFCGMPHFRRDVLRNCIKSPNFCRYVQTLRQSMVPRPAAETLQKNRYRSNSRRYTVLL